ncbi:hypothetical protein ACFLZW_02460 [Chloroflexota bacterium]
MAQNIQTRSKMHSGPSGIAGEGDDILRFDIPSGFEFLRCQITYTGKAYPGARVVKRPPVGATGKKKEVTVHWYFDGSIPSNNITGHDAVAHPYIDYRIKFITQTKVSKITKQQRALLVVNNIAEGGIGQLSFLYKALDNLFPAAAFAILGNDYHTIEPVTGANATYKAFKDRLQYLGKMPGIKAVDVFLCLHGLDKRLYFGNQVVPTAYIKTDLLEMGLKNKLRWLYSLSCYGASHAQDFIDGGFRVVEGAMAVNTNGPYDFPTQLRKWEHGGTVERAVNAGNNPTMMWIHDSVTELTLEHLNQKSTVNSKKIIRGVKSTSISSLAS